MKALLVSHSTLYQRAARRSWIGKDMAMQARGTLLLTRSTNVASASPAQLG